MRKRLIFLIILITGIVIFCRKDYIQCYENLVEYTKLHNEVLQKQDEVNRISAKTEKLLKNADIPELSLYKNLDNLVMSVDAITGSEIEQISALNICSDNTALYIATVENTEDVHKFSDKINGIEIRLKVNNIKTFMESVSKLDCLFHRVSIDEADKIVYIQILIV